MGTAKPLEGFLQADMTCVLGTGSGSWSPKRGLGELVRDAEVQAPVSQSPEV